MNELKLRIESLLQQLNERVFEKEHVVALSLLSAVQERVSSCSALRELPRVWWRAPETGFSGCLRFRVSHVPF